MKLICEGCNCVWSCCLWGLVTKCHHRNYAIGSIQDSEECYYETSKKKHMKGVPAERFWSLMCGPKTPRLQMRLVANMETIVVGHGPKSIGGAASLQIPPSCLTTILLMFFNALGAAFHPSSV